VTHEDVLNNFETQLAEAGFQVCRSGVNPIAYRLVCGGQSAGQVKVWAPLKPKFNEVRDRWRDDVKTCWAKAQDPSAVRDADGGNWREANLLLALFEPYRQDFLDFEDVAEAVTAALRADRLPAPDAHTIRYDFAAIERAARSRGDR
jgi:hypothetical protein